MFTGFRRSMAWLHTWIGLVLGAVLFAIFFTGSLSVFDQEIDRWMEPATRLAAPTTFSLDTLLPAIEGQTGKASQWGVIPPSDRNPVLQVRYRTPQGSATIVGMNPSTGEVLPIPNTLGASRFFLPFHYHLMIGWKQLGYWIAGFAACAMILGVVSGVLIHARLFANLFTFRPEARPARRMLDLHNLAGVSALPFLVMILVSGLLVSYSNLMPAGIQSVYGGDRAAFFAEVFENYRRPAAGQPGSAAPFDPMIAEAARRWDGGEPALIQVYNYGDQDSYVEMRRRNADRITADPGLMYFDGSTGEVLKHAPLRSAIRVQRWLTGLHMVQFDHWGARWLYFVLGMMGCATIATGMLVWVESRRAFHKAEGERSAARVEALAIGAITGPVIGALAYLVTNQLVPPTSSSRAGWELLAFFGAWALAAVHAFARHAPDRHLRVWREHVALIALLALAAPMLNWANTGSSVLTGARGVVWVDRTLLIATALAIWTFMALRSRQRAVTA